MRRTSRVPLPLRILAAVTVALLAVLGATACTRAKAGSDQKAMDAIAQQIQTALSQRPDVVKAEVGYQNNPDANARADASITVKGGTQFEPVIDETLRLIWQSKLKPLSSIRLDVVDADDLQRDTIRHVDAVKQAAELGGKYGPRPK